MLDVLFGEDRIDFLPFDTLLKLSQTSKYYHKFIEPGEKLFDEAMKYFEERDMTNVQIFLTLSAYKNYKPAEDKLMESYQEDTIYNIGLDYKKLWEFHNQHSDKGISQNYIGYMYDRGFFVEKNEDVAKKWYIKSAKSGWSAGMVNADRCVKSVITCPYCGKTYVVRRNFVNHLDLCLGEKLNPNISPREFYPEWEKRALDLGNPFMQYKYGNVITEEGLRLYKKAALKNNIASCLQLIYHYVGNEEWNEVFMYFDKILKIANHGCIDLITSFLKTCQRDERYFQFKERYPFLQDKL